MRIVGPAVEASKYFIEEAHCRDMFAKLIASSCDSSKTRFVHPVFPEIIKQLSPLDAKFLMLFKENRTYPVVELNEELKEGTVSPFSFLLFDLKDNKNRFDYPEQLELTKTVEILIRFGILKKNSAILELNYNYDSFKEHWFYKAILPTLKEGSVLRMVRYRVEPTVLGGDFVRSCLPDIAPVIEGQA